MNLTPGVYAPETAAKFWRFRLFGLPLETLADDVGDSEI